MPDLPTQRTSDHGWAIDSQRALLMRVVSALDTAGVRTSLFMDAATAVDADKIVRARDVGAARVELYTGPWAKSYGTGQQTEVLANMSATAQRAHDAGLGVNAGHDLNLSNLRPFVHAVPQLQEVSIGHAFIADALELGYTAAVEAYLRVLRGPSGA